MREYNEVVFNANQAKVKSYQFNLFQGFNHLDGFQSKKKLKLDVIYEQFRVLVNFEEDDFEYILNFLAHIVQNPHELPDIALIFISAEGVGKDITGEFISNVIGERYAGITEKLELLCGKFNTVLGGKLLMIINETNPVESRERQENIKSMITAKKLEIEGKHKDPVKTENFCRFMFFSNRLMAFPVEEGNRRPKIHKSSDKYTVGKIGVEENKKYFDKVVAVFQSKEYQHAFLQMLKERDISKWNPKDFKKSELQQTLEDNSISPIVSFLSIVVKDHIKRKTVQIGTTEVLKQFTDHLKTLNHKFDWSQEKFNVELMDKYNVKKIKSSTMKFEFNITELKEMLERKYKYTFEEMEDDTNQLPIEQQIKNIDNEIYALQVKRLQLIGKQTHEGKPNKAKETKLKPESKLMQKDLKFANFDELNDFVDYNKIIETIK